jgi:hypothetical protein
MFQGEEEAIPAQQIGVSTSTTMKAHQNTSHHPSHHGKENRE